MNTEIDKKIEKDLDREPKLPMPPPPQKGVTPVLLICEVSTGAIIMGSGRKPNSETDWLNLEPLPEEYKNTYDYMTDYQIWAEQQQAWKAARLH